MEAVCPKSVIEIRSLIPPARWRHCPGTLNPADIPSRGFSVSEFKEKEQLWLHGPERPLQSDVQAVTSDDPRSECLVERKARDKLITSLLSREELFDFERFSFLKRTTRVLAYVLRFVRALKTNTQPQELTLTTEETESSLLLLVKLAQMSLPSMDPFPLWCKRFGLISDAIGILRCQGRLANSDLSSDAKYPIFLPKTHHLTSRIIKDSHERVMHSGVKSTLTELRSRFWVVQGRQRVKQILRGCIVCRRYQGTSFRPPPAPPLPSFRVTEARPFFYTGVDYVFVRLTVASPPQKVWICLFTCCVTKAVHLELVTDMTTQSFIRSFKRFTSRRGFPVKIISDNAKTFKGAAKTLEAVMQSQEVKRYFSELNVRWSCNLERAPWWGGIFERMVQTTKRCLRKTIGRAHLTYDELLTSLTEVEMTLNSRPISYVSADDLEEALTPSHLLHGCRILSLPGPIRDVDESDAGDQGSPDLSKRLKHLEKTRSDFWRRWRTEYLTELREAHRNMKRLKGPIIPIAVGDIVIVYDERHPRGFWKIGRVKKLISGVDGEIRGASVRVHTTGTNTSTLNRRISTHLRLGPQK